MRTRSKSRREPFIPESIPMKIRSKRQRKLSIPDSVSMDTRSKMLSKQFVPDEIIVCILSKLDIRDVCRCRCVCRRWKDLTSDLTSDEYFVESVCRRSDPMIFVECESGGAGIGSNYLLDKWSEGASKRINCGIFYHKVGGRSLKLYAKGSQNGFIFFNLWRYYSIINPINNEHVRIILPKPDLEIFIDILGIYLHPVSREYCTIWSVCDKTSLRNPKVEYKMLNLGNQPRWRGIGNPSYQAEIISTPAVFVEDFFYWVVRSNHLKAIMSFDIKTEELSVMPLPHGCTPILHNVNGFLSASGMWTDGVNISLRIWTLKDRMGKLWSSSKYVVNYVKHIKSPYIERIIDDTVLFRSPGKEREILVGNLKHGTARKFICDSNGGKGWLTHVLFHKPSFSSLKKCKPLIRLDQAHKGKDLIEYGCSSSTSLNIMVEEIRDSGQSVYIDGVNERPWPETRVRMWDP